MKTDIVGTVETGAENTAKTGATRAAGEVVVGIFVSAATPSCSGSGRKIICSAWRYREI